MTTSSPRALQILNIVTAVMFVIALSLVFFYAPREVTMGEVQRIFYFHVPSAWVGGLAFFVTLVAGVAFLRTGDYKWDRVGLSSVEVGITFSLMTLLSGMLWARPIWNTWWTWDPRLTTFTILLLLYFAYLMLRQGIEDSGHRARFASVYGIVAFISVPITYFAIQLARSIHPVLFGSANPNAKGDTAPLAPPMLQTFFYCLFTFTVLYVTLLWHRIRLANYADRVEQLKAKAMSA
ncbi:MAG TPA: cytochrome c biogenesis protein CcsA [Anaerolineales bacterium]|nr:cytochrome c biogenesis protein CcsA [Anaerolineales bacterium]